MEEEESKRVTIKQLYENPGAKYAVFMRSPSGQSAKFKLLHTSLETAIDRCREYAATAVSHGHLDFSYYAVEIKHRVGIENGKLVDKEVV